jgi:hypothetical protein
MEILRLDVLIAGLSRRNRRFGSGTPMTLFTLILFKISKIGFLGSLSDYILVKIARIKKNDNFSFAVGLLLYTKHQHQRANVLFSDIHNFGNLTPRALYLVSLCASWQMNLDILTRVESESKYDSIKLFVSGLILHNSAPHDSIGVFTRVYGSYLMEHPDYSERDILPEYVRNSINVSNPLSQSLVSQASNGLFRHLERVNTKYAALPSGVSDLILISYTSSYLFALSDMVLGRIRKNHNHPIHLIISISPSENTTSVLVFCENLSLKYRNIFWSIVVSHFDLPVLSSVIRLVIAQELFDVYYAKSILILDGDTSFMKVDPIRVWEDIGRNFDVALLENQSLCPWERMSLGFTILNDTENTREFLLRFDSYVTAHFLDNRAFWTLDQTAAFLVLQAMKPISQEHSKAVIAIFDLASLVSLQDFIFTDKSLVTLKLRAKVSNRDFVSGMAETLYLP